MKKLTVTCLLLIQVIYCFSQWNYLTYTTADEIWVNGEDDCWAFRKDFVHWDGNNWDTVFTDNAGYHISAFFTSSTNGWAFNFQDSAYRWDGVSWIKIRTGFYTKYCHFSDATFGWAANSDSAYRYDNGNWVAYDIPGAAIRSVSSTGAGSGWILSGSEYQPPSTIYKFSLGAWITDTVFDSITVKNFCFTDASHGWLVGYNAFSNQSVVCRYDGTNWQLEQTFDSLMFLTIKMVNNSYGWIGGRNGRVFCYDGNSWVEANETGICTRKFSFGAANYGWVLDDSNICDPIDPTRHIYFLDQHIFGIGDSSEIDELNEQKYSLYPNPSPGSIFLNNTALNPCWITIYDVQGNRLGGRDCEAYPYEIETGNLKAGLYLMIVVDDDAVTNLRFIIE